MPSMSPAASACFAVKIAPLAMSSTRPASVRTADRPVATRSRNVSYASSRSVMTWARSSSVQLRKMSLATFFSGDRRATSVTGSMPTFSKSPSKVMIWAMTPIEPVTHVSSAMMKSLAQDT